METPKIGRNRRLHLDGLEYALAKLKAATGVRGRLVRAKTPATANAPWGPVVELETGGQTHRYQVEVKDRIDRGAALGPIKARLAQRGGRAFLFAPYLTAELADQCRRLDLEFLDAAGNAYLHNPELYLYIKGEKPNHKDRTPPAARGAGTATELRIVFALLNAPELLNAPYREIVEAADVALGAVGRVLLNLANRGFITGPRRGKGQRRFLERDRLLDEWVTNYPVRLRPKLNPRRFRAEAPDWWVRAKLPGGTAYWGGEVAADRLTHHLKPATQTIYLDQGLEAPALPQLVKEYRWRLDPAGNIEVLDAFWKTPKGNAHPDVVPPLLIYADLLATFDPRNNEVATVIRKRYLNDALRQG